MEDKNKNKEQGQQLERLKLSYDKPFILNIKKLNVNHLNIPIKRHILTEWVKKYDLIICCL